MPSRTAPSQTALHPARARPGRPTAAPPGPGARVPLSVERICEAALALVDSAGLEALSMRRLAAALAVDPMSIYHHVPNKQALLQGVYQRVLEELPLPAPHGTQWQPPLRELARRFYALARSHPRVLPGLFASRYATPRERDIHAAIDAILQRAGFAPDERLRLSRAIYTYAAGLAGVAASGTGGRPLYATGQARDGRADGRDGPDDRDGPDSDAGGGAQSRTPRRRRTPPAASPAPGGAGPDADPDLEYSIELMIAGIASLANRRR